MGENTVPPAVAGNGEVPGQPFYDKTRQHLKELLHKKRLLERNLSIQEDTIFRKETEYLEETPSGNIITGFDAYTKGTGASNGVARRRGGVNEGSRVFSRSSISFNPAAAAESPMTSSTSTPVAAVAPTPLSSSFVKGEAGSNHATPTSTTSANRSGAGTKRNKKNVGDDSETDTKEVKKPRTGGTSARK